jgi:hypothetical protein
MSGGRYRIENQPDWSFNTLAEEIDSTSTHGKPQRFTVQVKATGPQMDKLS